jgi:hypothetical protein
MDGELKISIDAPAAAGSRGIYPQGAAPIPRFLREDLELLRKPSYYIVLAASLAMQYAHGVAGQVRTRATSSCRCSAAIQSVASYPIRRRCTCISQRLRSTMWASTSFRCVRSSQTPSVHLSLSGRWEIDPDSLTCRLAGIWARNVVVQ